MEKYMYSTSGVVFLSENDKYVNKCKTIIMFSRTNSVGELLISE